MSQKPDEMHKLAERWRENTQSMTRMQSDWLHTITGEKKDEKKDN